MSSSKGEDIGLVFKAELSNITTETHPKFCGLFEFDKYIRVPVENSSSNYTHHEILVSTNTTGQNLARLLALALNGTYSTPWDFYFQLPSLGPSLHEHKQIRLITHSEFDDVLHTTNTIDAFRMVGPLQLAQYPSSALPLVTLSKDGYVTLYDQENIMCG
ncbi:hypothetical protein M501DRAFT_1015595 [Patellaria atrata CBS 101060]|uniref:Uncharacterized protein n=1 Tax=Patellaria atrata CBS 101060 TaxID=1346257 RepID=A0A9P4SBA8_9PEZI|nr:hypothetical protein M501DRAFT_1015595 [Patellaria atrata CBS 101060]